MAIIRNSSLEWPGITALFLRAEQSNDGRTGTSESITEPARRRRPPPCGLLGLGDCAGGMVAGRASGRPRRGPAQGQRAGHRHDHDADSHRLGGGAERRWEGTIAVSRGTLSEPRPLGIEADEPGSMWLEDGRLAIRQRTRPRQRRRRRAGDRPAGRKTPGQPDRRRRCAAGRPSPSPPSPWATFPASLSICPSMPAKTACGSAARRATSCGSAWPATRWSSPPAKRCGSRSRRTSCPSPTTPRSD